MAAGMRYQPQGLTKLARTSLLRGAQALISATSPANLITNVLMQRVGTVTVAGSGAGYCYPFRKNGYLETESLLSIGTASFVEFWFGYPNSDLYSKGSASAPGMLTGQSANNIGIAGSVGTNQSNTGTANSNYWGAVYNWPTLNHANEALTPGKLTVLVVVRRQGSMDFWRDGVMMRSVAQSPTSYPAGTMICGSFVENTEYWSSSSDTILAGRILAEWSAAEVRQFCANVWQLLADPEDDELRAAAMDGQTGAAAASGTFASTLGAATMTASGQVANTGPFSSTLGSATMTASGGVGTAPNGSFASTMAGCSMSAAGTANDPGAFAATMAGASMVATGTAASNAAGTFGATMQGASMYGTGYLGTTPPPQNAKPYRWRVMRRSFST